MPIKKEEKKHRHTCALCRKKRLERLMLPLIWSYNPSPLKREHYGIWACKQRLEGQYNPKRETCYDLLLKRTEAHEKGHPKLDI